MDFSRLSYGQITSLAEQLNNAASQMETTLNEVKTLFNKVGTDDVWSGTAASATKEKFDMLSAKFPEFSQAVNDCYKYLLSVVENYQAVDSGVMGS